MVGQHSGSLSSVTLDRAVSGRPAADGPGTSGPFLRVLARSLKPAYFWALASCLTALCWTGRAFCASPAGVSDGSSAVNPGAPDTRVPAWLPADSAPHATLDDLDALRRGQKGYGLSVFSGTERERFEVEVLGVWRNSKPELSYLLATLSGQGLEHSGVLGGMSGSPVYIDDKLVGAVAFSFNYGKDPVAGITPIGDMRRIAAAAGGLRASSFGMSPVSEGTPTVGEPTAGAAWRPTLQQVLSQDLDVSVLEDALKRLMPSSEQGLARASTVWTASGFTGTSRGLLEKGLGPALAPAAGLRAASGSSSWVAGGAGGGLEMVDAELTGGDPVAVMLVGGDLTLAAHGTVTDQHGDSILAFGHPVYSLGPVRLPMAESEVITSIASLQSSFKLSNAGRLIGVFDQDREAGARGILGVEPNMVPVSVALRGLAEETFQMYVADSVIFKPTLITMSTLGALNAASYSGGFHGVDISVRFAIRGQKDLRVAQSFDGNQASVDAALFVLSHAAYLELNDLQDASIEAVDVELTQVLEPRVRTLEAVYAKPKRYRAGDTVELDLTLKAYRGERSRRTFEVKIPEDIAPGRYYLMVGDGTSVDAAKLAVEPTVPKTMAQTVAMMNGYGSRKQLAVLGLVAARGLTVDGRSYPDLPGSMRAVLGRRSTDARVTELRPAGEWRETLDMPIEGIHRVDLMVER